MKLKVEKLMIYPVKSCGRLEVSEFQIGESGPQIEIRSSTGPSKIGDREWMFVDEDGKFLTQRTLSKMALIEPVVKDAGLCLRIQGQMFLVPSSQDFPRRLVSVWGKEVEAQSVPGEISQAASELLGRSVQLVHFDSRSDREALVKGRGLGVQTRFTDSQPYLVVSEESLQDLNSKLTHQIGPERFRPNILVSGAGKAYAEDDWKALGNEKIVFEGTKACARCKIITVDPVTGEIPTPEPLVALSRYRKKESAVYFGQYFLSRSFGEILRAGEHLEFQLAD